MNALSAWRAGSAALILAWTIILALFWRDAGQLVMLWWTSSTYTHCLIILPLLGWLVWLRRHALARLHPRGWLPGWLWVAAGAMIWLIGDAASVALLRQLGLVLLLQGCVPALLGPQVTRGLLFPLAYSLFLVPFGEELVPPMQTLTADMAMALLRLAGIPAYIDGIFITTPGGHFAVAEACSGVKFLVAMAALSVLAAHLCFDRLGRRALFILFALVVPVLANGVRAFSTIWIAEQWGPQFAIGADHVIYGWIFFALVMAIIAALAWPWFDRQPDAVPIDAARLAAFWPGRGMPVMLALAGVAAIAAAPVAWSRVAAARCVPILPIVAPDISGWQHASADRAVDWRARFDRADRRIDIRYADSAGRSVDLVVVGYAGQAEGREIVGFGQGAIDPDDDWKWGEALAPIGPARVDRIAKGDFQRDVATLYVVDGHVTASPAEVKWRTLVARLLGGDQRAFAILLSARPAAGFSGRSQITAYVDAAGGLDRLAARLTQQR